MALTDARLGRVRPAPENFLSDEQIQSVKEGRRDFLRKAFIAASAAAAAPAVAHAQSAGDPAILELQPWSTMLGKPVAANPYGMPSMYERNLVRRESPGLTRVGGSSVAFTPLQGLFGIITPFYLFEVDHLRFARRPERLPGNWNIFLNVLNVEVENGATATELRHTLYGPKGESERFDMILSNLYVQVLRPLCWTGLLREDRVEGARRFDDGLFTKTSLWRTALRLDTDRDVRPATHH